MIAPREARPTVKFVDEYCEDYRSSLPITQKPPAAANARGSDLKG